MHTSHIKKPSPALCCCCRTQMFSSIKKQHFEAITTLERLSLIHLHRMLAAQKNSLFYITCHSVTLKTDDHELQHYIHKALKSHEIFCSFMSCLRQTRHMAGGGGLGLEI